MNTPAPTPAPQKITPQPMLATLEKLAHIPLPGISTAEWSGFVNTILALAQQQPTHSAQEAAERLRDRIAMHEGLPDFDVEQLGILLNLIRSEARHFPTQSQQPPLSPGSGEEPDGKVSTLVEFPSSLNAHTRKLVKGFAQALADKLAKAEQKYGYSDGWMEIDWVKSGECAKKLHEHAAKGDPRDVAAYCAFLWYHYASTVCPPLPSIGDGKDGETEAYARFGKEIIDQAKLACEEECMGEEHEHQLELAAKLGAGGVRREEYNPEIHKPMDCDPGDLIWSWSAQSPQADAGREEK